MPSHDHRAEYTGSPSKPMSTTSPPGTENEGRPSPAQDLHEMAEAIRSACLAAAMQGYEEARIGGLCHDGAWENAVSAIRMVDLTPVLAPLEKHRT